MRQCKDHTRIKMLPFALDDQILQVLPGQRKPKMKRVVSQEFSKTLRSLDTLTEMAQPPWLHIFYLLYSVTLHRIRHSKKFIFAMNIPKAHIIIHISIKTNQKGKSRQDLLFKPLSNFQQLLPIVFGSWLLQENRNRVITLKVGKKEEKAESSENQNCISWGTNSCKARVTLIPAADDPGSP